MIAQGSIGTVRLEGFLEILGNEISFGNEVFCGGLDEPDGSRCAEEGRSRVSSQVMEQLCVRGGNGSQKFCSPRESLGISHSPATWGLCIYLPLRWLQNSVMFPSGLLEG